MTMTKEQVLDGLAWITSNAERLAEKAAPAYKLLGVTWYDRRGKEYVPDAKQIAAQLVRMAKEVETERVKTGFRTTIGDLTIGLRAKPEPTAYVEFSLDYAEEAPLEEEVREEDVPGEDS